MKQKIRSSQYVPLKHNWIVDSAKPFSTTNTDRATLKKLVKMANQYNITGKIIFYAIDSSLRGFDLLP